MNPYRSDLLRLSAAIAERMTNRLTPFGEDGLKPWLNSLALTPAVSEIVTRLHQYMYDQFGDGTKRAVLVFATIAAEVDHRRVAEAVSVIADRAVRAVATESRRLNSVPQLLAAVVPCCGGREDIADALVEAFRESGPDGYVTIDPDPDSAGVAWESMDEEHVRIRVGGRTAQERMDGYLHAVNGLHGSRVAISTGVVPGGGVTFARAAEVFREEADDDTTTGSAAKALVVALETPLRAWATKAGCAFNELLHTVREAGPVTFDADAGELHSDFDRPSWDATEVTTAVINRAAEAVADLFAG